MFRPRYNYTENIIDNLQYIERIKTLVDNNVVSKTDNLRLKRFARLKNTHYSTAIEGNLLSLKQVGELVARKNTHVGLPLEQEALNYWKALEYLDICKTNNVKIDAVFILKLHTIITENPVKPNLANNYRVPYPPGIIFAVYDSKTGHPEYIPPAAEEVSALMSDLLIWLNSEQSAKITCPVRAAIASYRLVTIHPFEDGNGRLTRALATYILMLGNYSMNDYLSVEEIYYNDLQGYYGNLQMGLPALYYSGRIDPDLTPWIEYFTTTMRTACEQLHAIIKETSEDNNNNETRLMNYASEKIAFSPKEVAEALNINAKTAERLCKKLYNEGILVPLNLNANLQRIRKYRVK